MEIVRNIRSVNGLTERRRAMKVLTVMVVVACMTIFGAGGAVADDNATHGSGKSLHDTLCDIGAKFRDHVRGIMAEYRGLAEANQQLKAAGASYQKSLTADPAAVSSYTTVEQQSIMSGVYLFDAAYAALFLKKKDMAAFLKARKTLNEKIGFGMALAPKMKKLLKAPESIRDYWAWIEAVDESMQKLLADGLTTDNRLHILVDKMYGAIIEGLYVVSESIAQADYAPEMLALLNQQHDRLHVLIKLLNVFRGDEAFERTLDLAERFDLLEDIHSRLIVEQFTKREVEGVRKTVAPEREAIIKGEVGENFKEL